MKLNLNARVRAVLTRAGADYANSVERGLAWQVPRYEPRIYVAGDAWEGELHKMANEFGPFLFVGSEPLFENNEIELEIESAATGWRAAGDKPPLSTPLLVAHGPYTRTGRKGEPRDQWGVGQAVAADWTEEQGAYWCYSDGQPFESDVHRVVAWMHMPRYEP